MKRLLFVVGMHRSSTSAVAGAAALLGAATPRLLVPAHSSNPKGHYESLRAVEANDSVLSWLGQTWFDCRAVPGMDPNERESVIESFRQIIESEFEASNLGVLKDPRITLLLPEWKEAARRAGWTPAFVICFRKPEAVADSLRRRNGWSAERSLALWLRYTSDAERQTRGDNRMFLDAEKFVAEPVASLDGIAAALDFAWPLPPNSEDAKVHEFIEAPMLGTAKPLDTPLYAEASELYHAIEQLAADPTRSMVAPTIDRITAYFDHGAPALQMLIDLREILESQLGTTAEALSNERHAHQLTISDLAAQKQALSNERHAHQLTISDLAAQKGAAETLTQLIQSPWHTSVKYLQFFVLETLSRCSPPLPKRVTKRYKRSAEKRDPRRSLTALPDFVSLPAPIATSSVGYGSATTRSPDDWAPKRVGLPPVDLPAKLVAFYLPQFHPIAENDAWWGKGFTEWRNVTRAVPSFSGHHQPHLPADLGFYDLRVPEVMKQQVDLARLYGIGAFCFYFYWFAGRTLLERPLRQFLENPDWDMEFCVCWANENWTRRWDGFDRDVLIAQRHSPEDDLNFISYVAEYLRDPRNLRIDGKPVLLVYRPELLPDSRATAERWRTWCRENGLGEIFLTYVQTVERVDPDVHGFDAAVEFPPNNTAPPKVTSTIPNLRPDFTGSVYDWTVYPKRSESYTAPDYMLFRGTTPSWDNTARRGAAATVFLGSNPSGFQHWLENAITETAQRLPSPDSRLVFINAWNEWAEGAHLEPDLHYGHAFLQAAFDAQKGAAQRLRGERPNRIAVVAQDAHLHGAQYLALNMGKYLRDDFHFEVDIILLGQGALKPQFESVGRVIDLSGLDPAGREVASALAELVAGGCKVAIANTVVAGSVTVPLKKAGFRVVSLVRELPGVIHDGVYGPAAQMLVAHSDYVVFPAEAVRSAFEAFAPVPAEKAIVRPQGLYKQPVTRDPATKARIRADLRARLGILEETVVVLAMAYADFRKGVDLFTEAAISICKSHPDVIFVWGGNADTPLGKAQTERVAAAGLTERILFIGFVDDLDEVLVSSDIFALPSREDPFPSVLLDALDAALPVVAFDRAGGFCDLLRDIGGVLADEMSAASFAEGLRSVIGHEERQMVLGANGRSIIERDFGFRHYVFQILQLGHPGLKRVSVVVPNFNYLRHLEERLASITDQTYPIYELIVLDDASTDGSDAWLRENLPRVFKGAQLIVNDRNSGSVFHQWKRGAQLATGDLLWIAEADDVAEPDFLSAVVKGLDDPRVALSYSQSCAVDGNGQQLGKNYLDYVSDLSPARWRNAYVADGPTEIVEALAVKNTIPNVSAVVFRREALLAAMEAQRERLKKVRVSGDWLIYLQILANGGAISFNADVLNRHRRHSDSTTSRTHSAELIAEIAAGQELASRLVDLPRDTRIRAASYLVELGKTVESAG